jgi:outer membrane receptor protein involved in Fe transport
MRKQQEASMKGISGRVRFSSTSFFLWVAFWSVAADAQVLVHFDLPAQPLAQSLNAIGTATNTNVGFSASQVAGLLAPPLKADLTVDGALMRVLAGTGLRSQHLNDRAIVIAPVQSSTSDSAETKLLPTVAPSPMGQTVDDTHTTNFVDGSSFALLPQTNTSGPDNATNSESKDNRSPAEQLEEIVVTGSHIRGIENKTNPVIVIDRAQIDQSGYSSTQDLFRSLPQNFQSANASQDGIFGGAQLAAANVEIASGVSLRGLGVSSTLVLLNGHRIAPSIYGGAVDVSLIPLSAIERVEILTDGSSAIYGSDAVGGVVNIILNKDYQGADTSVRYGNGTDGHRGEEVVAQTFGTKWSRGNAVGTIQYQDDDALSARDRNFASSLPLPSDLLPKTRTYSATLDARQALMDGLDIHGDMLLSKRDFQRDRSVPQGADNEVSHTNGDTSNISIAPGSRYEFSANWAIELNALYSRLRTNAFAGDSIGGATSTTTTNTWYTEKSADLVVTGHWKATTAGDIGVAIGGSYRREDARLDTVFSEGPPNLGSNSRHVSATFGEVYVPLVGSENQLPLAQALDLSLAIRLDAYSDVGSTTNPRVGLRWSPWTGVSIRASYNKSFRAPNPLEQANEGNNFIYTSPFANPAGPGTVPTLLVGGSANLKPERAQTNDFGIEYRPSSVPGASLVLSYYDILYRDRIIFPPYDVNALQEPGIYGALITRIPSDAAAQALVNSYVAAGYQSFVTSVAGVRYLYNFEQTNASIVRQSGVDFISKLQQTIGAHTLTTQLNVAFIDKIDTAFAPGATSTNLVNTLANPAKWRARAEASWGSDPWSVSGALNSVSSYSNTSAIGHPSIASWTTVDLSASLNAGAYLAGPAWNGLSVSVVALNLLNRDPPYVNAPSLISVNYDPSNANPLGRFVALTVRKKW